MTKDELSKSEIQLLEANMIDCKPMMRNVIKHILELVRADKKANDEPKPNFNVGDKVVVTSDSDYFVPYVGKIVRLEEDSAYITVGCGRIKVPIDRLKPYAEPTAEEEEVIYVETVSPPAWQSYRMELAAKIAVAYAEKGRYEPYEIGAKAVEVANGVVERLKNCKI